MPAPQSRSPAMVPRQDCVQHPPQSLSCSPLPWPQPGPELVWMPLALHQGLTRMLIMDPPHPGEVASGCTSAPPHPSHGCTVPPVPWGARCPPGAAACRAGAVLPTLVRAAPGVRRLRHLTQGDEELAGAAGHRRESGACRRHRQGEDQLCRWGPRTGWGR